MQGLCSCGSGKPRRRLYDAAGIFCASVCDACEAKRRQSLNPYIFEPGTRYAKTGEEIHIPAQVTSRRISKLLP